MMRPTITLRRDGRTVEAELERTGAYVAERSRVADMGSSPVKVVVLVFTGLDRGCPENSSVPAKRKFAGTVSA
jgi:hypothetical protein